MWHRTDLKPSETNQTLTYSEHGFGLFPGICGFFWASGDVIEEDAIRLNGIKDYYTDSDFEIVDRDGKPIKYLGEKKGTVSFERKRHIVVIKIYIDGKPFELNGRHSYREKRA